MLRKRITAQYRLQYHSINTFFKKKKQNLFPDEPEGLFREMRDITFIYTTILVVTLIDS